MWDTSPQLHLKEQLITSRLFHNKRPFSSQSHVEPCLAVWEYWLTPRSSSFGSEGLTYVNIALIQIQRYNDIGKKHRIGKDLNRSCSAPPCSAHTAGGLDYSSLEKGPVCVVALSLLGNCSHLLWKNSINRSREKEKKTWTLFGHILQN